jgi:anaerobic nitric oxide reductase flavorubredoxin
MKAVTIKDGVYRFTANLETSDIGLFEGIWPIPEGVSLNSYFVQGEKGALVDLVCDWDGTPIQIENQMKEMSFSVADVDYIVLNHMEPDHTSWLPHLMDQKPDIKIICTPKAAKLVKSFYDVENVETVKSGDTLDLGGGKVFHFQEIPNVHWPETMVTYEESTKVLFTCDAFGSFGRIDHAIFDDEMTEEDRTFYTDEALRYYTNIVSTFSSFVLKAIDKVSSLDIPIEVIAPSHGIIYRKNPMEIVNTYHRFASYMNGPTDKEITLIWSSMYGNTQSLVESLVNGVKSEGVPINVFQVPQDHVSYILPKAWKSSALIIGMPTYEYKMFPPMAYTLDMFARKHVWHKKVLRFGSYGWSGGAQKEFDELTKSLKWEFAEPIEWEGRPDDEVKKKAYEAGKQLARDVKAKVAAQNN